MNCFWITLCIFLRLTSDLDFDGEMLFIPSSSIAEACFAVSENNSASSTSTIMPCLLRQLRPFTGPFQLEQQQQHILHPFQVHYVPPMHEILQDLLASTRILLGTFLPSQWQLEPSLQRFNVVSGRRQVSYKLRFH